MDIASALEGCVPVITAGFLRSKPGFLALLDLDGRILRINDCGPDGALVDASMCGQPCWDLWAESMRPRLRQSIMRARLGDRVGVDDRDGVSLTPVRDAEDRVVALLIESETWPSVAGE